MEKTFNIIGLGEVLWDVLPTGKMLGGAPTNFAYYVNNFDHNGIVASRIGNDLMGKEILLRMERLGLDSKYIQIDKNHQTGIVDVDFDIDGQPNYFIHNNVSWDYLEFNRQWKKLFNNADAICFGTLAQRSLVSRKTINYCLESSGSKTLKFLDINLRQDFFSYGLIVDSIKLSNILKLNSCELRLVSDLLDYPKKMKENDLCIEIIKNFDLSLLCLTRGENGSLIMDKKEYYDHPGYKVTVVDTIGAGDAFSAAVVVNYLEGKTLNEISDSANRIGALVSSNNGAIPILNIS